MHHIYCKGNRIVFSGDYDTKVEALRVFRDEQSGAHVKDGEIILAFTSEDPFEGFNEVNVMDYVNDGTFTFIEKIMDYHHGSK